MFKKRAGISLIELLVVMAIISILLGLLMVAVQRARAAAARTDCANRLKQLGLSLHSYHDFYQEFPNGHTPKNGTHKQHGMSWMTRLLPFLGYNQLWEEAVVAFQTDPDFELGNHQPIRSKKLNEFVCPVDLIAREPTEVYLSIWKTVAFTSYLGVSGTDSETYDGILYLNSHVPIRSIIDGTSNTLLVGERPVIDGNNRRLYGGYGWWYAHPGQFLSSYMIGGQAYEDWNGSAGVVLGVTERLREAMLAEAKCYYYTKYQPGHIKNPCSLIHFWSMHDSGANFLFADGSVRFLPYSMEPTMEALSTRAGGEIIHE